MEKIFTIIVLSITLSGCIITKQHDLHNIITENVIYYEQNEPLEFENVAAILKSYSNLVNSKRYKSSYELKKDKELFISNLKIEKISKNYPIKASNKEIIVVDEFLSDVIKYIEKQKIVDINMRRYVNEALNIYVIELIHDQQPN